MTLTTSRRNLGRHLSSSPPLPSLNGRYGFVPCIATRAPHSSPATYVFDAPPPFPTILSSPAAPSISSNYARWSISYRRQASITSIRGLGVNTARRTQEEDVASQETTKVYGWEGIEGCNQSQQMLGMRESQERTPSVLALCPW